jgi:hypothetical protein
MQSADRHIYYKDDDIRCASALIDDSLQPHSLFTYVTLPSLPYRIAFISYENVLVTSLRRREVTDSAAEMLVVSYISYYHRH